MSRIATAPIYTPSPTSKRSYALFNEGFYENAEDGFTSFLRFYTDGTVLSVSSLGTASQIVGWFHRDHDSPDKGTYEIDGSHIAFATPSGSGTVEYTGTISGGGAELHLHVLSHINGHESDGLWRFNSVEGVHDERRFWT